MMEIEQKTGVKKLADTLKRCGIASSIHDAHRMANDITSTEKKVQTFFDQKREQIQEENITRHHNLVGSQQKPKNAAHVESNFNDMVQRAKNPQKIIIQADFDMPKRQEEDSSLERIKEEVPTLNEALGEKEDYINQYITGEKEEVLVQSMQNQTFNETKSGDKQNAGLKEVISVPKVDDKPVANVNVVEKKQEPQINIHDYFNFSKRNDSKSSVQKQKASEPNSPQQTLQSSVQKQEPHPKTGNNQGIDINEYFNFAKRGLL